MKNLLSSAANKEIVYVNDSRELKGVKGLSSKRLCIIKTDFKDINKIKKICKSYPKLEVWLACEEVSRKNIITANMCGIKNVIQYPVKKEVVYDLLNNDDLTRIKNKNNSDDKNNFEDLKGLKVMIVDDNHFNTELLEETLKPLELNITTFQKPIEASKIIDKEKFDLFLLDIMMPDLSGYELAQMIKKTKLNSYTPIIFVSALSDNENKLKSFELGSYIYIEKPFNIKVIKSQINSLLKEQKEKEKIAQMQDSYLAMVTHDMKGPVQAEISALNFLLNKDNFGKEEREILYNMLSSSKYLQNLVSNVLQKFKSERGIFTIQKENNSLKNLISECCDEVKYFASEKNIKIIVSNKTDIDFFKFDLNEVKRVIHNLLTNALKYSYKNTEMFIEITDNKNNVIISVKNSGAGVNEENQKNIFDKFISYCEKEKSVNTGLGLYICKQIINAHGGNIIFESIPEQYTKITFTLPIQ